MLAGKIAVPIGEFLITVGDVCQGSGGDETCAQYQGVYDRRRARNAFKTGEGEQHDAGHQLADQNGLRQDDGIVNGKIARHPIADAEGGKCDQ